MEKEKTIHQGRNVKRFRVMLGMKQDKLAEILGKGWDQGQVSLLEAKEEIEPKILDEVAKALKIPAEAIKNFNEEAAISVVANTFHDFKDNAIASAMNYHPTFNPLDELIKLFKETIKEKDKEIARLKKGKK